MTSPTRTVMVLLHALALAACGAPCETGEACDRRCPTGGIGLCAAHGLCACVAAPDGGLADPGAQVTPFDGVDAGGPGDPAAPGAPPGIDAPTGSEPGSACAAPSPGTLIINELMLDGEPTEDAEFVELVNLDDRPAALAGVVLTSNRGADHVRRVEFIGGCLPARGALALFPDRGAWIEAPVTSWPLEVDLRSFGFSNSGDFEFRLTGADEQVLDELAGPGDLIAPGVSLNRDPDLIGDRLAPHATLDPGGRAASPGGCPNGGTYAADCQPDAVDAPADGGADVDADGGPPPIDDRGDLDAEPPDGAGASLDAGLGGPPDAAPDASPDVAPEPDCPPPAPGDLVISEVLVDGAIPRSEHDEFVELVNRTPLPRRLGGLGLGYERGVAVDARVRFGDGCLAPHGAIVIRPRLDDWGWVPERDPSVTIERADLALGNASRDPLVLVDDRDRVLARFALADGPIVEGVSLTRHPGLAGVPTLHDRLGPRRSSPGSCPDGRLFGPDDCAVPTLDLDCTPPHAGDLLLDEVLIDGVEPGESDEFIELVNRSDRALTLDELTVSSNRTDGTQAVRVRFERGCLPAGARVAMYARFDDWRWSIADPLLLADVHRFGFPNEEPFTLELAQGGRALGVTHIAAELISPGVSAARRALDPASGFERHDSLAPADNSPGRATGAPALGAQ